MKHRDRTPEQDDLLRPRLVDMIDMRHELVKLAGLIDWEFFEREWAGFFPSTSGRPATHPRLVAGLMYLQHTYGLSDEAVVAWWVENPYFQHFTGETFFQHTAPIHPSSLSRWRDRIGEEGAEWLLTKTIQAGRSAGVVDDDRLSRVSVDTKVSVATTIDGGFVVGMRAMPGNPYDGHTLAEALEQIETLTDQRPALAVVDRGYRGHDVRDTQVLISGRRRGLTKGLKAQLRRRSAIEPEIGHMKTDGRLARCPLKGTRAMRSSPSSAAADTISERSWLD